MASHLSSCRPSHAGNGVRRRRHGSLAESGQAVVFILAMIPVIFISVLLVYNSAISAREKIKLQNTADATTYSASVLVARNLNYLAYTNRAMAANEAGIAMFASLQTTTGALITTGANIKQMQVVAEGYKAALNLSRVPRPLIGIVYFFRWLQNVSTAARLQRQADRFAGYVEPAAKPFQWAVDVLRVLNQGISASQEVMMAGTLAQIPQTVQEVLRANDPEATVPAGETAVLVTKFAVDAADFLKIYHEPAHGGSVDDFNEVMRFAHAAQATRDDFTKQRRIFPTLFTSWMSNSNSRMGNGLTDLGRAASDGGGELGELLGVEVASPGSFIADALTGGFNWRGGTELVAVRNFGLGERGRIRWQSGDNIDVMAPLGPIMTQLDNFGDVGRLRFGIGAGAAAAGGPHRKASWEGYRLTTPTFYELDVRAYGKLTGSNRNLQSDSFEDATDNNWGMPLLAPMAALQFSSRFHYGPRTDIGTKLTRDWAMPRFVDVKEHRPMVAHESDNWLAENGFQGRNPLRWGSRTNNGPTFTLVVQKAGGLVRTGEVTGFGHAEESSRIGLKDFFADNTLKALSSAQVYFKRPQDRWARRDHSNDDLPQVGRFNIGFTGGYIEHRSLFSPYWQVHNIEPSLWARGVAMGMTLIGSSEEDGQ